jgi:hypothetical protein
MGLRGGMRRRSLEEALGSAGVPSSTIPCQARRDVSGRRPVRATLAHRSEWHRSASPPLLTPRTRRAGDREIPGACAGATPEPTPLQVYGPGGSRETKQARLAELPGVDQRLPLDRQAREHRARGGRRRSICSSSAPAKREMTPHSAASAGDPDLLARPPSRPVGGDEREARRGPLRRLDLDQVLQLEPVRAQDSEPVAV